MEKLEIRKSIERTKAIIVFAMVLLALLIPSLLVQKAYSLIAVVFVLMLALGKRILRLNFKLNSLTK